MLDLCAAILIPLMVPWFICGPVTIGFLAYVEPNNEKASFKAQIEY
jgi:hypothetical protein